ncbi:MAG: DUF4332 domain-containing protein [Deltaproteobacteria bacterium]|nr:DUF4332 domain-containing protein [Deltaproteobacteria bacterium]
MYKMIFPMLALFFLLPAPAFASHYDLASIDLVDATMVKRLAGLDIRTTEDLYNATRTGRRVARLASKIKVQRGEVREWRDFCDMLWIRGVGPKVVRVLKLTGVRRLTQMSKEDPARLLERIRKQNHIHGVLGKLPGKDTVEGWIEQARDLVRKRKKRTR